MADRSPLMRHIGFGIALLVGFALASAVFLLIGMGECLPRDGSAQMLACEAGRRRDIWLYPALYLLGAGFAVRFHLRQKGSAMLLALTAWLLAGVGLMLVNAFAG